MSGPMTQRAAASQAKQFVHDSIDRLGLPSDVVLSVLSATEEGSGGRDLASLVEQDPVLAGRILRMARSPFFSGTRPVTTVLEAVNRLGARPIRNLVIASELRDRSSEAPDYYAPGGFMTHSLTSGTLCRAVAAESRQFERDLAYLAGLMHDVGELCPVDGLDHTVVGAMISARWRLPDAIRDAIALHHESNVESGTLAGLVCACDFVCRASGVGLREPMAVPTPPATLRVWVDSCKTHLEEAMETARAIG
ncbi:MAG: HDOD domain-containing protein [Myxococcota bacterium]